MKTLLEGRSANGIIFTTMFKFERGEKPLSERRNIVVMADEAHRGQYGFDEKIVISENEDGEKEARTVIGNARVIHDALPNATFIGFTGTPISAKDRNTREVFGDYIDVYDMTQAVEDDVRKDLSKGSASQDGEVLIDTHGKWGRSLFLPLRAIRRNCMRPLVIW